MEIKENWLMFGWLLILAFIIFMSAKIIINIIRNERNRKSFQPNIKIGDQVSVPVVDRYFGEVLEVNGDEVKIIVTAPKSRVYPE